MSQAAKKAKKPEKEKSLERFPAGVSLSESQHPRYTHVVRWPGPNGKRLVKWFTNDTQARNHAKKMSAEAGEVGAAFGSITEEERAAIAAWRAFVEKERATDSTPPEIGPVLADFREQWKRTRSERGSVTVEDAVGEFLQMKEASGVSPRHLGNLRARLGRFSREFGNRKLASFTTPELAKWILNLQGETNRPEGGRGRPAKEGPLSGRTKINFRQVLHIFFEWATIHKDLPDNPVTKADRPQAAPSKTGILKAEDVKTFLHTTAEHAPRLLAFYAVRTFAGIREAEAARMDWGTIDLKAKRIILPAEITKRKRRRIITIQPALAAFLRSCKDKKGPLVGKLKSASGRAQAMKPAKKKLPEGFTAPANWSRHTMATMHLNHFHDPGLLALELGHVRGPQILHDIYEGEATPEEAKEFWKIRPKPKKKPRNVVTANFGANDAKPKPRATKSTRRAAR